MKTESVPGLDLTGNKKLCLPAMLKEAGDDPSEKCIETHPEYRIGVGGTARFINVPEDHQRDGTVRTHPLIESATEQEGMVYETPVFSM